MYRRGVGPERPRGKLTSATLHSSPCTLHAKPCLARIGAALAAIGMSLVSPVEARQRVTDGTRVEGVLTDTLSGRPIPFAVVRVAGTDNSTLTNSRGRYVVTVALGEWQLEFRKIGYRMVSVPIVVAEHTMRRDVWMRPIPLDLGDIGVVARADNPALQIIRQAIARKNDVFSRIRDYRYNAYVKLLIRDMDKPVDSTESVLVITETQTSAYWEQPNKYQETITARRQSRNLPADDNLVSVGEIVNFNKNRIDLTKYSVVSPTADDALSHYNYQLIDSLMDGDRKVYRLAIEPKTNAEPLFVGMIDIADSTFDVLQVDVGANEAIRFDFFENLRYHQTLAPVGDDYWMPAEIRFTGEIHFGVPLPGVPKNLSFQHIAALTDFRFDEGNAPRTLGEYQIIVDEKADDADSTSWYNRRSVPLTELEQRAYSRIDSLENLPASWSERLVGGTLGLAFLAFNPNFFHYNRAEGVYLGVGSTLRDLSPDATISLKLGHSFGREEWQYRLGGSYRLSETHRLWVGGAVRDEIVWRPTIIENRSNSTPDALLNKSDPLDYYRSRGYSAFVSSRVADFTTLRLQYNDFRHWSVPVVSDFSFFSNQKVQRDIPPVTEGRLRSVSASLSIDSRRLLKRKGRDYRLLTWPFTLVTLSAELANPGFINNDFQFFTYSLRIHREQRTFALGITTVDAYVGSSSGRLPPQRYFTIDFSNEALIGRGGFNTMAERNFSGNRAGYVFFAHDFDQQLFRLSRIPVIKHLPFTLSVHGGAFWSTFVGHTPNPGDDVIFTAPSAYSELGFGLGNLTPWIAPFNFSVWFTWQLSSYPTDGFDISIGIPGLQPPPGS